MQGLKPAQLIAWMESNSNYYEAVFCSCQICVLKKRVKVFRHNLLLSAHLCSLTCESKQQPRVNISKLRSEWCITSEIMSSISLKPLAELVQLSATTVNRIIGVLLTYNWKQEHGGCHGAVFIHRYNTLCVALVMTTISQLFQIRIFIFPRNPCFHCFQPPCQHLHLRPLQSGVPRCQNQIPPRNEFLSQCKNDETYQRSQLPWLFCFHWM